MAERKICNNELFFSNLEHLMSVLERLERIEHCYVGGQEKQEYVAGDSPATLDDEDNNNLVDVTSFVDNPLECDVRDLYM